MEKQLQKVNQNIVLSGKQVNIALLIVEVNMIIPYSLSDLQIETWSRTIDRLIPDLDTQRLADVLDDFKRDIIQWDNKKGIQNLFNALEPKGYSPDTTN